MARKLPRRWFCAAVAAIKREARAKARGYNRSMSLPLHAALAVKLLCWLLALVVFFRLVAQHSTLVGPDRRGLLAATVLGALVGSKSVYAMTYPAFFLAPQDLIGDRALAWLSGDSMVGALRVHAWRFGWRIARRVAGAWPTSW